MDCPPTLGMSKEIQEDSSQVGVDKTAENNLIILIAYTGINGPASLYLNYSKLQSSFPISSLLKRVLTFMLDLKLAHIHPLPYDG